jgi:hypothetical protein
VWCCVARRSLLLKLDGAGLDGPLLCAPRDIKRRRALHVEHGSAMDAEAERRLEKARAAYRADGLQPFVAPAVESQEFRRIILRNPSCLIGLDYLHVVRAVRMSHVAHCGYRTL